jgi:2-beta-glucuronyltransferase
MHDPSSDGSSSGAGAAGTVVLFSSHLYFQRRRGGLHWVCDALRRAGWDARFITCDFSLVTRLKGDRRTEFGEIRGRNRSERVSGNLSVGIVHTPFHPLGRDSSVIGRALDRVTSIYPLLAGQAVERFASGADLVIVESCGALMAIDSIRRATQAPIVYRVSDNLRAIRPVPSLLAAEQRAIAEVDAVSLASEILARDFIGSGRVRIDPMGLEKVLFDRATESPYEPGGRPKVVISGSSGLDVQALDLAARALPDWDFVQFGSADRLPKHSNVLHKGEVPFAEMVPWVKFADIGFAPYRAKPGFEYQAEHSNRLLQYVYSGLPCVVPEALCSPSKPHYIGYRPGDIDSIGAAFQAAARFERERVPRDSVIDWDQLALRLAGVCRVRPEAA